MNASPNACLAASWLCVAQSTRRLLTVVGPPRARGTTWSSSRRVVDPQTPPDASCHWQHRPSRAQTARFTSAGMCRGLAETREPRREDGDQTGDRCRRTKARGAAASAVDNERRLRSAPQPKAHRRLTLSPGFNTEGKAWFRVAPSERLRKKASRHRRRRQPCSRDCSAPTDRTSPCTGPIGP